MRTTYSKKDLRSKARDIISANKDLSTKEILDKLANDSGFEVIKFKADEDTRHVKGAVISDTNGKNIFINQDLSKNERLFVYAHEVSHILLHSGEDYMDFIAKPKFQNQKESGEETEANMLAYELIFPLSNFIDSYYRNNGNLVSISQEFSSSIYRTKERLLFLEKNKLLSFDV